MAFRKVSLVMAGLMVLALAGGVVWAQSGRFFLSEPVAGEPIVADAVTGLIWQKTDVADKSWSEALAYCEGLTYAGQSDWRLPDVKQLSSLLNYGRYNPATDFPEATGSEYWSSTTAANTPENAWVVVFANGHVSTGAKGDRHRVRCVRAGN